MVVGGRIDCATLPNKGLQAHVSILLYLSSRHGAIHRTVASLFALRIVQIDLTFSAAPRARTRQPIFKGQRKKIHHADRFSRLSRLWNE